MIKEETILLLNFNGLNNSTTFSEETGKTVVANGDAKISTTQSVFGGSSGYFDGTDDYLSFDTQSISWDFSLNNWTLECWVYPVDTVSRAIFMPRDASTFWPFGIYTQNANKIYAYASGGAWDVTIVGTTTLTLNAWNHIAFVRYKNNFYLFVNGVRDGVGNYSGNLIAFPTTTYIGKDPGNSYSDWKGYIDSFRLIKGRALYTENFTVPTEQFQYDPYYNDYTSLLIPFDGPNNSTVFGDYSLNRNIITANGDVTISTAQSKFGGSSGYFDGTGDYLSIPDSNLFVFGTNDFTIECWIKTSTANKVILDRYAAGIPTNWQIYITSSGYLQWYTNTAKKTGSIVVTDGNWHHIAVVKSNNILNFYIDGVVDGTGLSDTTNYSTLVTYLGIGAQINSRNASYDFNGYIDSVRITKGIARYTGNFTVPTQAFYKPYNYDPFLNQVALLLHMDGDNNTTVFNDSSVNNCGIMVLGDAKISTAQSVFGGSSGYFDGTGAYLTTSGTSFDLGTENWTIEFYFYRSDTNNRGLFGSRTGSYGPLQLDLVASKIKILAGTGTTSWTINATGTTTINTGAWYHLAAVRNGGTFNLYLNGVLEYTSIALSSLSMIPTNTITVGWESDYAASPFYGYIDSVRITKGIARYTGNFTPSVSRFYDLIERHQYFFFVYDAHLSCKPGEAIGDFRSNSIVFTQEPMPFEDMEDGGTYFIEDYVTYNGAPASRRVDLYILQSRRLIRSVWSDPITGYYRFDRIKPQLYFVWCEDYLRVFDPVTHLVQVG